MIKNFLRLPDGISPMERNTFLTLGVVVPPAFLTLFVFLFLSRQQNPWQFYVNLTEVVAACIFLSIAVYLAYHGRVLVAAHIISGVVAIILPLASFLISGLGISLALSGFLLTVGVTSQILPSKQSRWAIITSVTLGFIALIADLFSLTPSVALPQLAVFSLIISSLLVIVYLLVFIRQFRNFPLNVKLISVLLLASLVPIVGLAYYNTYTLRQNLINSTDAALTNTVEITAAEIERFIEGGLNDVAINSRVHILQEYLNLTPAERPDSETEQVLYTDLNAFAQRNPYISSVSLMDKNGIDVADTFKADLGQNKSDRIYFTEVVKTLKPYVSPVLISASTGKASLYFSAPVYDQNNFFIGVYRVRYDFEALQDLVSSLSTNKNFTNGFVVLFDENFIRLADSESKDNLLKTLTPLPAEKLAELQTGSDVRLPAGTSEELSSNLPDLQKGLENNLTNNPYFEGEFHPGGHEASEGGERGTAVRLSGQPWIVAYGVPQSSYLTKINSQTRISTLLALLVAVLVTILGLVVSRLISRPVEDLTLIAQQVANGNLDVRAQETYQDEIGTLGLNFNKMTSEIRHSIENLDRRAKEIQLVAEVSQRLSTILDQKKLLNEVVQQIKYTFNYYHAHIYLLDPNNGDLIMAGGTGEAGQIMLGRNHKIPQGRGLVGRAAETRNPVLVSDTSQDPNWLPNPLLPETASEVAVPILSNEELVGVLDVQHNVVNGLKQNDAELLQTIAYQVATALKNAQAYSIAQQKAEQETVINTITRKIQNTSSVEQALQVAVRELGQVLGTKDSRIMLELPDLPTNLKKKGE
ncbi:MAG: GAF domain-containing protein [Anaerolineales bacterium]